MLNSNIILISEPQELTAVSTEIATRCVISTFFQKYQLDSTSSINPIKSMQTQSSESICLSMSILNIDLNRSMKYPSVKSLREWQSSCGFLDYITLTVTEMIQVVE